MQDDGAVGVAGPLRQLDVTVGRMADRVQGLDEVTRTVAVAVELLEHLGADPGHDAHGAHHVRRVGELHAEFRVRRVQRAHAERYHVHGPALHAPRKPFGHGAVRFLQTHPVAQHPLGRTSGHVDRVPTVGGAYERPAFNPGHVPGTAPGQKAVKKNVCWLDRGVWTAAFRTVP